MKIKIGINDVIRDFSSNFDNIYKTLTEELEGQEKLNEFNYQLEDEIKVQKHVFADLTATGLDTIEVDQSKIIYTEEPPHVIEETGRVVTLLNLQGKNDELALTTRYVFKSQEEYFYYLFSQYSFEFYGKAKLTYKDAMTNLNEFMFINRADNDASIFSQEINNARPSTLHFLARERFVGQNIEFYESLENFWKGTDVAITTSPFLLNTKPKNKVSVKIETSYNTECEADFSFKSFNEFLEYYKKNNK